MSKTPLVAVVGASGKLGQLVVHELVRRGAHVRAVVRPRREVGSLNFPPQGVDVMSANLDDLKSLLEVCAGTTAVISTLQGGPETIIDRQLALLQAATEAGVKKFVPSDFSFNFFALAPGENINSDWRREFASKARLLKPGPQILHILNGCFLDRNVLFGFLGAIDTTKRTLQLWGDGSKPMDFTTFHDTAAYTAAAVLAQETLPDHLYFAGTETNAHGLVRAFEEGSGKRLEVINRGTLQDLDRLISERQSANPADILAFLPLMYWRGMLNGKGKAPILHNALFPDVTPTSVTRYVLDMEADS